MIKVAKFFITLSQIFCFWLIFPIIVGAKAKKAMNTATNKAELGAWPILTFFFCNWIGGIIMLCMSDSHFG